MTGWIRLLLAGCVTAAASISSVAGASIDAKVAGDSVTGTAGVLDGEPFGIADSLSPVRPGSLDSLAAPAPPDDPTVLAAWLDRIRVAGARLPEGERLVFDELMAAASEMLQTGDPEATRLLGTDALEILRQEPP